ncbi:MAG: radical SAM protein [Phycisphaerae bacterium]|nr:radical SAM protein [Phycisphaerae bacterium]
MSKETYHYLFGPVPSRRLGRSLGVDIVPFKTCTQNCIYCQLGKDTPQAIERKEYVPIDAVLDELKRKIAEGLETDVITISGSGEPTLNSGLGKLLDSIKQLTDVPVVVITNGTLLSRDDVRADCAKADIVMPSLDAGDPQTFETMNHPHPDIDYDTYVEGLCRFRQEFKGSYWLEVFFCEGVNTDPESIRKIKEQILRIRPDKVQLNTSVRPITHPDAARVSPEKLNQIAQQWGNSTEVIADFSKHIETGAFTSGQAEILDMLRRRPCSADDICDGLGLNRNIAQKLIQQLLNTAKIVAEEKKQTIYYKIR